MNFNNNIDIKNKQREKSVILENKQNLEMWNNKQLRRRNKSQKKRYKLYKMLKLQQNKQ